MSLRSAGRLFAVIPAAGHSLRMGRPKLLLPRGDSTVLECLLQALAHPRIAARRVVVRAEDQMLAQAATRLGAEVVQPAVDPPDMKTSVEWALKSFQQDCKPRSDDGWLLIPADHPWLTADVLSAVVSAWEASSCEILVPNFEGRRGHPTLFRWTMAERVSQIPADRGLNWLLERFPGRVFDWPCPFPEVTWDLDTPDDYARLLAQDQRAAESRPESTGKMPG